MKDPEIEQVEHDIEKAKRSAIEAGIEEDPDTPHFYETGELSDIDDQTIAPPG